MTPAQQLISERGITFKVERNGTIILEVKGLPNHESATSRKYVGFMPGTDVKTGDWIINPANERFYVEDTMTSYFLKQESDLKAYYQTSAEYKSSASAATNIFNIGTANGSVIGSQSNFVMNYNDSIQTLKEQIESSDSEDKEDLQQIVALLEMIVNNQVPAQKGILSKFSAVMQRNSWITGSIASALLSWLTAQIL